MGLGLLSVTLVLASALQSTAQVPYSTARHMTRSLVWLSFTNWGTSGMHYHVTPGRVMMRMSYPGNTYALYALLGTEEFEEYWGSKGWGHAEQKTEANMHSAGEGVLVLTNVDGEKFVSVTGPRTPTEDVEPQIYDIQNQKEATWGIPTVVPDRGVNPRDDKIQLVERRIAPKCGSHTEPPLRDSQLQLQHLSTRADGGRRDPHFTVVNQARCVGHAKSALL